MARFHADHNVSAELVRLLQAAGHDCATAQAAGLSTAGDDAHLLCAARDGRTLLTNNLKDFVLLHNAWRRWLTELAPEPVPAHAGILIVEQRRDSAEQFSAIQELLSAQATLGNELYRWRRSDGWARLEPGTGRLWAPIPTIGTSAANRSRTGE